MTAELAASVAASSTQDRTSRRWRPGLWFLYHAARLARRRSRVHQSDDLKRTTDVDRYRDWRARELKGQLAEHFSTDRIAGLNVLDFGCGTGELCRLLAGHEPSQLTGVDISERAIERARALADAIDPREGTGSASSTMMLGNQYRSSRRASG